MAERKIIYLDDAINVLERKKDKKAKGNIGGFYNKIIQNDIDALMQLPSAQPERTKGRWIDDTYCDQCGWTNEVESGFIGSVKGFHFCPNCGAEMGV